MDRQRRSQRSIRAFLEGSWPVVSRAAGLLTLLYTVVVAAPIDRPTYVAVVLVLLTAPTVTGAQERRNRRRDEDDG